MTPQTADLVYAAIVVVAPLVALWLLSLPLRDTSIIDSWWGTGFVVLAWALAARAATWPGPQLLLLALVTIWGLRLSIHIFTRNLGHGEDPRYRAFREEHGKSWPLRSLFTVFLLQGALLYVIAAPIHVLMADPGAELGILAYIGVAVWLVGFIFEAGGDAQLRRFKADPNNKGKVMDKGFWRYTRHPNYFGDAVQWWGYGLIAFDAAWGPYALIGPALMMLFLMRVTGVTHLEKGLRKRRPEYADYIERTNAFFPGPPRSPQ